MTNAESKRRWRARRRGENVPKLKPWGDTGKGVYKWPANRVDSWKEKGNPNWQGENACKDSGRGRAQRKYPLGPCIICGNIKTERHHVDGNPLNNLSDNVMILCRLHHMMVDGRRALLIARIVDRNKMRISHESNSVINPDVNQPSTDR